MPVSIGGVFFSGTHGSGGSGASPAGSDKQLQKNSAGSFGFVGKIFHLESSDDIAAALAAAESGDVLELGPGIFNIPVAIVNTKSIHVIGKSPFKTILNWTGAAAGIIWTQQADGFSMRNVGFTGTKVLQAIVIDGTVDAGFEGSNILIENCRMTHSVDVPTNGVGGISFKESGGTVRNCVIDISHPNASGAASVQHRGIYQNPTNVTTKSTYLYLYNNFIRLTIASTASTHITRPIMFYNDTATPSLSMQYHYLFHNTVQGLVTGSGSCEAFLNQGDSITYSYGDTFDGGPVTFNSQFNDLQNKDNGSEIYLYGSTLMNRSVSGNRTANIYKKGYASVTGINLGTADTPNIATGSTAKNANSIMAGTGGTGGATSIATTGTGGVGSGIALVMGSGGVADSANTVSNGGVGGAFSITGGVGGAAVVATGTNNGGKGGNIELVAGQGGAASGGATNNVGAGGNLYIAAGVDGAGSAANGGDLFIGRTSGGVKPGNIYIQQKSTGSIFLNNDQFDSDLQYFSDNGATPFFIDGTNSGRVGMGNSNPTAILELGAGGKGATTISDATPVFFISKSSNNLTGVEWINPNTGTSAAFRLMIHDTNGDYIAMGMPGVNITGNSFGTAQNTVCHFFSGTTGGSGRHLAIGTIQAKDLILGTTNAERMRILSGGNVGIGISAPDSLLHVAGSMSVKRTAVNDAAYTILNTDHVIAMTALSAPRTLTLPSVASAKDGKIFRIKDESGAAGTHTITIDGSGAEQVDGAANKQITTNYGAVTLYCNGSAWFSL